MILAQEVPDQPKACSPLGGEHLRAGHVQRRDVAEGRVTRILGGLVDTNKLQTKFIKVLKL